MYTIKLTELEMQALIRKAGAKGAMVRDYLIAHSDQAVPVVEKPAEPPPVPNAMGTYRDQSKSLRRPAVPNAMPEGADAPEDDPPTAA